MRSSDRWYDPRTVLCVLCTIVTVLVVAPTVLSTSSRTEETAKLTKRLAVQTARADRLTRRIAREGRKRRDQTCRIDERDHLDSVKRLRRTYDYLEHLPRAEYGSNITVAIVRQLPDVERDARHDVAPPFCDAPNVGLPEPDPKLPRRRSFKHLLAKP